MSGDKPLEGELLPSQDSVTRHEPRDGTSASKPTSAAPPLAPQVEKAIALVDETSEPAEELLAKLRPREATFVAHYIQNGGNGARAYIAAGYRAANNDSAATCAARLLGRALVRSAVRALQIRAVNRTTLGVGETLLAVKRAMNFDVRKCYDDSGVLLPPHKWPDEIALAVAGVKTREKTVSIRVNKGDAESGEEDQLVTELQHTKELRVPDRIAAAKLAMQHLKLIDSDGAPPPMSVTVNMEF